MPIRTYRFSQVAIMPVEGVGIHASFSISIIVRDERIKGGNRSVHLSAHGNSNAAKAAGTGKLLFWCTVTNNANHKKYVLDNKRDEMFAAGVEDMVIGSAKFIVDAKHNIYPSLTVEGGYILADYTGQHIPLPGRIRKVIKLEPFQG